MDQIIRDIVVQPFETFNIAVQVTPTQLTTKFTKVDLITSFILSVDQGAANNVFMGGGGVSVTNGIEIVAGGGPIEFFINNQKQHYELQEPVISITEILQCAPKQPRSIPIVVWDLSQIYLIAAAITNVRVAPIRAVFI
jgi:hypothetical protein